MVESFGLFSDQREHLLLLTDIMALTTAKESAMGADSYVAARQTHQFFTSLMFLADAERLLHIFLPLLLNLFLFLGEAVLEVEGDAV